MGRFILQLNQPCLKLVARFTAMADLGLEPRHLRIGSVHLALRLMQRVAGSEMGLPHFFRPHLGFAQRGILRFQFGQRAYFERHPLPLGLSFALPEQPQKLLALHQLFVQRVIAAATSACASSRSIRVAQFEADVFDPRQGFRASPPAGHWFPLRRSL